MKKMMLLLLLVSLLPSEAGAWSTPGEDFSGEMKLGGAVTNTRNPWVWKLGQGNKKLDIEKIPVSRTNDELLISVPVPTLNIVLGKTILTTPAGRDGLSPKVIYGKETDGCSLTWTDPGIAKVTLPVTDGAGNRLSGSFTFRMQVAGVLRHVQDGQPVYAGVYDDLKTNGLPPQDLVINVSQISGVLKRMFSSEGPAWLQEMVVAGKAGLSQFSNASLRQVEGAYGAQVLAGSGELRIKGEIPERWRASLPVSIEYQ
ncbi:fimbrial protein [Cronobacter universalis]|uniref:F4 family fimbrial subunit n=1 Tax=Cronobacter universalis TaxID=535744 RepID=UPI003CF98AE6